MKLATELVSGLSRSRLKIPEVFSGLGSGFEHLKLQAPAGGLKAHVVVWTDTVQGQEHAHELGDPQDAEQPFAIASPGELPGPLTGSSAQLIAQLAILDELLNPVGQG